jgi:glutaredoxin
MNITIYTLQTCPYCNYSLNLLDKYNIKYKNIIVNYDEKNKIKKITNMDTFPMIFLNNNKNNITIKIGGSSDLQNLINISDLIQKSNIDINILYNFFNLLYPTKSYKKKMSNIKKK